MNASSSLASGATVFLSMLASASAGAEARTSTMSAQARPEERSDAELLSLVASGDLHAFAQFYDRHASVLFGLAIKLRKGMQIT